MASGPNTQITGHHQQTETSQNMPNVNSSNLTNSAARDHPSSAPVSQDGPSGSAHQFVAQIIHDISSSGSSREMQISATSDFHNLEPEFSFESGDRISHQPRNSNDPQSSITVPYNPAPNFRPISSGISQHLHPIPQTHQNLGAPLQSYSTANPNSIATSVPISQLQNLPNSSLQISHSTGSSDLANSAAPLLNQISTSSSHTDFSGHSTANDHPRATADPQHTNFGVHPLQNSSGTHDTTTAITANSQDPSRAQNPKTPKPRI